MSDHSETDDVVLGPEVLSVERVNGKVTRIVMPRPSNFHAHFRWTEPVPMMAAVAPHIMRGHKYVLAMPNNGPDQNGLIRTIPSALRYREMLMEIARQHADCKDVELIMTLYHTSDVTPAVIEKLARLREDQGIHFGIKHYPPHQGATTGSGFGVPLEESHGMLRAMEQCDIPLLGHFESLVDRDGHAIAPRDREGYFMSTKFRPLRDKYPELFIVIEHGSTIEGVARTEEDHSGMTAMSVTPPHMLFNDSVFGLPGAQQYKCMPILKPEEHRAAIAEFATSGSEQVYAGTDIAPHPLSMKLVQLSDAANGCFTPDGIAMYADAFNRTGKLGPEFVNFMCFNAPKLWGLEVPDLSDTITLVPADGGALSPIQIPGTSEIIVPLGFNQDGPPTYTAPFQLQPSF